jgi:hypothetical protein
MAAIVIRRTVDVPRPGPRGPGGSLSSLTWVGWLWLLVAVGWFLLQVRPIMAMGDVRTWAWDQVLWLVWRALAETAIVGLPAALEWGVPGARRRVPWLMRGAVLLALAAVLDEALVIAQSLVLETLIEDPTFGELGEAFSELDSPGYLALQLLRLGTAVVTIGGVWSLSDGLSDAGASVDRRILAVTVVAGLLLATWYLPGYVAAEGGAVIDLFGAPSFGLFVVGAALGAVQSALWLVVAVRLVAGWRRALRPGRAWFVGALSGVLLVASDVLTAMLTAWPDTTFDWRWTALSLAARLSTVLLLVAFAAGLGRGTVRREPRPRYLAHRIVHARA